MPFIPDILPVPGAIRFADGLPDVSDLISDEIELDGAAYMRRHFLLTSKLVSVRFHEILLSDSDRHLHDHPWDFTSLLLSGRYIETTEDAEVEYCAPALIHRRAETLHRLTLPDGPVWTYVVTGRVRRPWGFQTDDGWVHWAEYARA